MSYEGSVLQGIQRAIASRMQTFLPAGIAFTFHLGQPDDAANSVEPAVIWTQPEKDRYRYEAPRYQEQYVGLAQGAGDKMLDRYCAVDVLIRAPGSEARLLQLSDAHLAALDFELGAVGSQGECWRIEGRSDGGGDGVDAGVWEERFTMLVRYQVARERFTEGQPLVVDTSLDVEGPAVGENVEVVL